MSTPDYVKENSSSDKPSKGQCTLVFDSGLGGVYGEVTGVGPRRSGSGVPAWRAEVFVGRVSGPPPPGRQRGRHTDTTAPTYDVSP